jgi:hypothetical protein
MISGIAALFLLAFVAGQCWGDSPSAKPDWVPDPANSVWISLGEKAESHGLFQRLAAQNEGLARPARRGGRACWEVAAPFNSPLGGAVESPVYWAGPGGAGVPPWPGAAPEENAIADDVPPARREDRQRH